MGKTAAVIAGLCATALLGTVGLGSAAKGSLLLTPPELRADVRFTPKALSRQQPQAVSLSLSGSLVSTDGGQPPSIEELVVEGDRNVVVDVRRIPLCFGGEVRERDTAELEEDCGQAIVGEGKAILRLDSPAGPTTLEPKLVAVNGGVNGGRTTWFLHADVPGTTAPPIVSRMTIERHVNGRYGSLVEASLPRVAEGTVSIVGFELKIDKNVKGIDGRIHHPVKARCSVGILQTRIAVALRDGTNLEGIVSSSCTPKG